MIKTEDEADAGGATTLPTPDSGRRVRRGRAVWRSGPLANADPVTARVATEKTRPDKPDATTTPGVKAREKLRPSTRPMSPGGAEDGLPETGEVHPKRRLDKWITGVVAILLILGLVAVGGFFVRANHQADIRDTKRQAYIQAARQIALNLTSIQVGTAKRDIEQILDSSTGRFREEFDGRIDPFVSVVETAKVDAVGEIVESGLESESENEARVIVAARSMVTNGDDATPRERDFRLRITVTDQGDRMLISQVEFVA